MTAEGGVSPARAWRPVDGGRASNQVVNQIKEAFFDHLEPGDWLGTEHQLAEQFGVSRITIRDAIRALEASGLVSVKVGVGGGLRIADPNPDQFVESLSIQLKLMGVSWDEIVELRDMIEPAAAALAAERCTDVDIARLQAVIDKSKAAAADPDEFTRLALEFHVALAETAGNRVLVAVLLALRGAEHRHHVSHTSEARARRLVRVHQEILDALQAGDAEAARGVMQEHLRTTQPGGGVIG